jgi:hypothetical protein
MTRFATEIQENRLQRLKLRHLIKITLIIFRLKLKCFKDSLSYFLGLCSIFSVGCILSYFGSSNMHGALFFWGGEGESFLVMLNNDLDAYSEGILPQTQPNYSPFSHFLNFPQFIQANND